MTTIETSSIAQRILKENNFVVDASSVNLTAQNILDENKWTVYNISLANLETLIDNSINYINLEANTTISLSAGTSGSKTVTLTRSESLALKSLTALMVRAYLDKGPNIGLASLSVVNTIDDPNYSLFSDIVQKSILRLKTANPIFVEYLIKNAIDIINLHTNTSIAVLSGTSGSKNLTATASETVLVKLVASEFLQNHMAGSLSGFKLSDTVMQTINFLRGRRFATT